jgi:hypothetical protein
MAFGFPAQYSESRSYQYGQHQLALVLRSAFDNLGWQYKDLPNYVFVANLSLSLMSWGEKFTVEIHPDSTVRAESKCAYPLQCIDWGRNRANTETFFARFESMLKTELGNSG